jgi:hypothetical protein
MQVSSIFKPLLLMSASCARKKSKQLVATMSGKRKGGAPPGMPRGSAIGSSS